MIKKITAVALILSCLPMLTGCSEFLKRMAERKIETFFEQFAADFESDPTQAIIDYSAEEITFDEFHPKQMELALSAFTGATPVLDSIKLNDKRTKAELEITLEDVRIGDIDLKLGTYSEFSDAIQSLRADDVTFEVTLNRTDDGWQLEDLSEMKTVLYEPYLDNCILDEDGTPFFINEYYIESIYVGTYWYDPISGNPVTNRSATAPVALINVFYFNQPMYMDFQAQLILNDEVVYEQNVSLDGDVVATCDFDSDIITGGSGFERGDYTVRLLYDGALVTESDSFRVN